MYHWVGERADSIVFALGNYVPSEFLILRRKERMDVWGHLVGVPIWDKSNFVKSDQKSALPIRNYQAGCSR